MKHLGLLGLGSESTMYYFKKLNEIYNKRHGGYSTCPIKLLNTDFNQINPFLPNDFENLEEVTKNYLEALDHLDVECIVVPNITLHETIDRLKINSIEKKIIHAVDETIEKLMDDNVEEVFILGTKYTMNSEYLQSKFEEKAITMHRPSAEQMKEVDQLRKDLYDGIASKEQILQFQLLCGHSNRIRPIVLACTELSFLVEEMDIEVYDMATIQMEKAMLVLQFDV